MRNGEAKTQSAVALEELGRIEGQLRDLTERLGGLRLALIDARSSTCRCSYNGQTSQEEIILEAVCVRFNVSRDELFGPEKIEHILWARFVAMALIRLLLAQTFARTARLFGNRDHGTAFNACRRVDDRITTDRRFACQFALIKDQIETSLSRGTKTDGAAGTSSSAPSINPNPRVTDAATSTRHA
jgi:hypothetical protein